MFKLKLFAVFFILISLTGSGCASSSGTVADAPSVNTASSSISENDVLSFLLALQRVTDLSYSEYRSFASDSLNPDLQDKYATTAEGDVPLMRYLGRKGSNDLTSHGVENQLADLRSNAIAYEFSGSLHKAQMGLDFLQKFYADIETLSSFDEFKTLTADMISARDEFYGFNNVFSAEYANFKLSYTDFDYIAIDRLVATIFLQNSPKRIAVNDMDKVYSYFPIRFTGDVTPNATKIVVTANSNDHVDVYTLQNFSPGDSTFWYQVAPEWDNLFSGENIYTFTAYYNDGSIQNTYQRIHYSPSVLPTMPLRPPSYSPGVNTSCCKVCTTGQACGDSCISRSYTCHKGPGCACDG